MATLNIFKIVTQVINSRVNRHSSVTLDQAELRMLSIFSFTQYSALAQCPATANSTQSEQVCCHKYQC